jgi:hypothetical protein
LFIYREHDKIEYGKAIKNTKKGKKKDRQIENAGKVLINLGQLMFATLFLGSVLRDEVPQCIMMIAGIAGGVNIYRSRTSCFRKRTKNNGGIAYVCNADYGYSHNGNNTVELVE